MNQAEELNELLPRLKTISSDILVYSGYTLEELRAKEEQGVQSVLKQIAVLIDGEYIEELNDNSVLRGSSNQKIHILSPELKDKYETYFQTAKNQIQNFTTTDGIVSVGIHRKGF